jgi:hypothetical protein
MHGLTLAKSSLDESKILITVMDNVFGSVLVGRAIMQCRMQSLAVVDGFDKGADGASGQIDSYPPLNLSSQKRIASRLWARHITDDMFAPFKRWSDAYIDYSDALHRT